MSLHFHKFWDNLIIKYILTKGIRSPWKKWLILGLEQGEHEIVLEQLITLESKEAFKNKEQRPVKGIAEPIRMNF